MANVYIDWADHEVDNELAQRLIEIRKETEALKDESDVIRGYLLEKQVEAKQDHVQGKGWKSYVSRPKPRRVLSTRLLLQNGVEASVIENSYMENPVEPHVVVKEVKE